VDGGSFGQFAGARCTRYASMTPCSWRDDKAARKRGANSANHEHISYRSAWGRVSDNRDISRWPQRLHRRLSSRGRRSGVAGQLSTGAPVKRSAGLEAAPHISRPRITSPGSRPRITSPDYVPWADPHPISSASSAARHSRGGSPEDRRATRDNNLGGNSRNSPCGRPPHTHRKPG
jgi:hypothetical protein